MVCGILRSIPDDMLTSLTSVVTFDSSAKRRQGCGPRKYSKLDEHDLQKTNGNMVRRTRAVAGIDDQAREEPFFELKLLSAPCSWRIGPYTHMP